MAYATVQTFGVDVDVLQAYLPQIGLEGTGDLITEAKLTTLIQHAAAEVCGILGASGLDPSAINDEPGTVPYLVCQRAVAWLAIPSILIGITGIGAGVEQTISNQITRAKDEVKRLSVVPPVIGAETGTAPSGRATGLQTLPADATSTNPVNPIRWSGGVQW